MLLCLGPLPASKLVDFDRQRVQRMRLTGRTPLLLLLGYHIFYSSRLGAHDFYKKNVCAALKLEVNDPVIMQQIRLSLDGLAGLGCCYV